MSDFHERMHAAGIHGLWELASKMTKHPQGKAMFLAQTCVSCHAVRGTPARGTYAPDLTHMMSRKTLASGIVENTPATLADWVRDPQTMKPGCLMPAFGLSERDQKSIVSYLLTLR